MLMPRMEIQRREPLTSAPSTSVAMSRITLMMNTTIAERRTCRGERNETPIITRNAGRMNITCRLKKWNGSRPMRVATGGLAASDRMMPPRMRVVSAASSRRSTVHHHWLKGVRRSREIIREIPAGKVPFSGPSSWFTDR